MSPVIFFIASVVVLIILGSIFSDRAHEDDYPPFQRDDDLPLSPDLEEAERLLQQGENDSALSLILHLIKQSRRDTRPKFLLAKFYINTKDFYKAAGILGALKRNPFAEARAEALLQEIESKIRGG